jgi:hypothetical protein
MILFPLLSSYTMDRYSAIVKYKTSYYSFYLPVVLAMAMVSGAPKKYIETCFTRFHSYLSLEKPVVELSRSPEFPQGPSSFILRFFTVLLSLGSFPNGFPCN